MSGPSSGILGGLTLPSVPIPVLSTVLPPIPSLSSLAGLPPLPSLAAFRGSPQQVATTAVDTIMDIFNGGTPSNTGKWGIYNGGTPVAVADTVNAVDYRSSSKVSDYPVEQGGFGSYNKVQMPFDAVVTLTIANTLAARTKLLSAIDAAKKSLNTYQVVTPEVTYTSATIEDYNYSRKTNKGATMLTVEIMVKEVRVVQTSAAAPVNPASASASSSSAQSSTSGALSMLAPSSASSALTASNTVSPSASDVLSGGTVQTAFPTALQAGPAPSLPSILPSGLMQGSVTGLIMNAIGTVQRDLTATFGSAVAPVKQAPGL